MQTSGFYEIDDRGDRCFRPARPQIPNPALVNDVLEPAIRALTAFDLALTTFDKSGVIGRLFARLDAVHSSGAEGSTTTFTDLLEYESSLHRAPDPDDAESVAACADAVNEAAELDEADPRQIALRIHQRLFQRSASPKARHSAGRWKERTNRTFDRDMPGGMFNYTSPHSLPSTLSEWHALTMDDDTGLSELVRQGMSHWMFEHAHPFDDGNGRVGRLLVPIMLKRKGWTSNVCAFFGEAVHDDKETYIEALKESRITGNMVPWIRVYLAALRRTAQDNLVRLSQLQAIEAKWLEAVDDLRADSMAHKLVPWMLTRPAFTIKDAVAGIGGTFASVNTAAGRLADLGMLEIAPEARRDRLFMAWEVLDVFDRFRPRPSDDSVPGGGGPP